MWWSELFGNFKREGGYGCWMRRFEKQSEKEKKEKGESLAARVMIK